MIALSSDQYMTPEEYLAFEKNSEIKHEYIDGEIYAMAGGTGNHNLINLNCAMLLRNRLRGSSCRTYMSDMKANIADSKRFFYPDVLVTCDQRDQPTESYTNFPTLIIETLSPATENFDRNGKFQFYRTIPTLQEYLLINVENPLVECFRRQTEDIWTVQFYQGLAAIAHIEALDIDAPLTEIYESITFPENSLDYPTSNDDRHSTPH